MLVCGVQHPTAQNPYLDTQNENAQPTIHNAESITNHEPPAMKDYTDEDLERLAERVEALGGYL